MLYIILQIIAFQTLFLAVYDLFLKRETFFNHNRAYLLITAILSVILPFIKLPKLKAMAVKDVVIQLPEVFIGTKAPNDFQVMVAERSGIILEQPNTPLWQIIGGIGIAIATLIFLYKIAKLFWLKHKNPKRWKGNVLIVKLIKSSAAFSFFNTIFLGERISEFEKPTIYKHELVHIKELHTLDLLFFEIFRIVMWFNPLVYIYQNRIKELHEYIADAKAIKQNGKADYYQSLLNQVFDVNNVSFTNTFFKKSLIKKRIAMLQKSKSKQLNLIKYSLLLPLIFGMLIYTSTEVRAQQKTETKQIVDQELTDEELVKKYYDEFVEMDKDGEKFVGIMESLNSSINDKYIQSRDEYLKFVAFGRYMRQMLIEKKSEDGTLTQQDIDTTEEMKSRKYKTYAEYREWKKTDEAKEQWELGTQDGILKLVVNDLGNQTEEEQKRLDGLMKQLETDDYFKKLVVCEIRGASSLIIDSPNNPHPDVKETLKVVESIEVPFSVIDEVPTLKECKDLPTNAERKRCMSDYVAMHVNKRFNTDLADSLPIKGRQRIFVSFKIDKQGGLKDVKARASHPALEEEAIRVINTLPQFIPGRQKGKLVVVPYSLPIVFQIHDDATSNSNTANDSLATPKFNEFKKKLEALIAQRDRVLKNSNEKNPVAINLNNQIDALKEKLEGRVQKDSVEIDNIPYSVVDLAPIHQDCKTLTDVMEQRKCTSKAVSMYVNKNFNTNMAKQLNLYGKQRIFVSFNINKEGNVTNVKARAQSDELKAEAIRVIKGLPQFVPGQHKGEVVNVPYSLPIVFQVNKAKKD